MNLPSMDNNRNKTPMIVTSEGLHNNQRVPRFLFITSTNNREAEDSQHVFGGQKDCLSSRLKQCFHMSMASKQSPWVYKPQPGVLSINDHACVSLLCHWHKHNNSMINHLGKICIYLAALLCIESTKHSETLFPVISLCAFPFFSCPSSISLHSRLCGFGHSPCT